MTDQQKNYILHDRMGRILEHARPELEHNRDLLARADLLDSSGQPKLLVYYSLKQLVHQQRLIKTGKGPEARYALNVHRP